MNDSPIRDLEIRVSARYLTNPWDARLITRLLKVSAEWAHERGLCATVDFLPTCPKRPWTRPTTSRTSLTR
jgi:hypothetical protein